MDRKACSLLHSTVDGNVLEVKALSVQAAGPAQPRFSQETRAQFPNSQSPNTASTIPRSLRDDHPPRVFACTASGVVRSRMPPCVIVVIVFNDHCLATTPGVTLDIGRAANGIPGMRGSRRDWRRTHGGPHRWRRGWEHTTVGRKVGTRRRRMRHRWWRKSSVRGWCRRVRVRMRVS